jgi:hypothetical protein
MGLPKKIKKDLDLQPGLQQTNPRQYLENFIDQKNTPLPRGIDFTDLDGGFVDWVNTELELVIDGEKIPVTFLTAQRWTEFTKTWQSSDKYKNIKIPFISVVRKPEGQPGTNPSDFKIPVRKTFPYMVVPTWDGNRKGADVYMAPQPVGVDLTYTIRFFTYRMAELNVLNQKVLKTFSSSQSYVNIKGNYFPIILESVGDESTIDNIDEKRYYVQTYELKMMAYTLDKDEFKIVPAVNRTVLTYDLTDKRPKNVAKFIKDQSQNDKSLNLIVQFLVSAPTYLNFQSDSDANFTSLETENITAVTIRVNGNVVTVPFTVHNGDLVNINIVRMDATKISEIMLRGTIPL